MLICSKNNFVYLYLYRWLGVYVRVTHIYNSNVVRQMLNSWYCYGDRSNNDGRNCSLTGIGEDKMFPFSWHTANNYKDIYKLYILKVLIITIALVELFRLVLEWTIFSNHLICNAFIHSLQRWSWMVMLFDISARGKCLVKNRFKRN